MANFKVFAAVLVVFAAFAANQAFADDTSCVNQLAEAFASMPDFARDIKGASINNIKPSIVRTADAIKGSVQDCVPQAQAILNSINQTMVTAMSGCGIAAFKMFVQIGKCMEAARAADYGRIVNALKDFALSALAAKKACISASTGFSIKKFFVFKNTEECQFHIRHYKRFFNLAIISIQKKQFRNFDFLGPLIAERVVSIFQVCTQKERQEAFQDSSALPQ
eukprot:TRINITY_DN2025_c0_g1_i1.p1 TRINITY_DN2025_c0_g1~~TRINITY_DN2025_c0_g1_i1.p1  ORF type:complete len:222 (-),score=67.29 TRINITY_DN2025_c0_g1_i1:141-806(-)